MKDNQDNNNNIEDIQENKDILNTEEIMANEEYTKNSFLNKHKETIMMIVLIIIAVLLIIFKYERVENVTVDDFIICEHSDDDKFYTQESLFMLKVYSDSEEYENNGRLSDLVYRKDKFEKAQRYLTLEACCNRDKFRKLFQKYDIYTFEDFLKMDDSQMEEFEEFVFEIFRQKYLY